MNKADDGNESTGKVTEDKDVYDTFKRLRYGMKSFISAERIKVDEEDVAIDWLQYYKSKEFDPKIQFVIKFRGQPGVDSGGLLRQAFTSAFEVMAQNQVPGLKHFTGPPNRLTLCIAVETYSQAFLRSTGENDWSQSYAVRIWISLFSTCYLLIHSNR